MTNKKSKKIREMRELLLDIDIKDVLEDDELKVELTRLKIALADISKVLRS